MKKKCPDCNLVNYPSAEKCARCGSLFAGENGGGDAVPKKSQFLRRTTIFFSVFLIALAGFYVSMVFSAAPLSYDQKKTIERSIAILEDKGFANEAFLLKRLAVYRANDNWLNASVDKEEAFAATNFPFEIVTIYPEFFTFTVDDLERAAILLHEAKHLQGAEEKEAYEFVWRNRKKLGYIGEQYSGSEVWNEVRKQTREYVPGMFVCDVNPMGDCTESKAAIPTSSGR